MSECLPSKQFYCPEHLRKQKIGENMLNAVNDNVPGLRQTPSYFSKEEFKEAVLQSPLLPLFPSFVQTTYASFVLLTVCDERTFAFKTMLLSGATKCKILSTLPL
jgi:hypothetical protein